MVKKSCFLAIALSVSSGWALAETSAPVLKITMDQAKCIASNVDIYLGYGTDPVIVVPDTCPDPPTNDELMAALAPQNSGAGLPTPKVGEGDKVMILLQSQLKCIQRLIQRGTLSQNADGLVVISLGDCSE